jgi:hypothetical protein
MLETIHIFGESSTVLCYRSRLCSWVLLRTNVQTPKDKYIKFIFILSSLGVGYLTIETLKGILLELEPGLEDKQLMEIVEEVDEDGSGTIDFDGKKDGVTATLGYSYTVSDKLVVVSETVLYRKTWFHAGQHEKKSIWQRKHFKIQIHSFCDVHLSNPTIDRNLPCPFNKRSRTFIPQMTCCMTFSLIIKIQKQWTGITSLALALLLSNKPLSLSLPYLLQHASAKLLQTKQGCQTSNAKIKN